MRKNSTSLARYRVQLGLRNEMWGTSDARLGCEERCAVQLCALRGVVPKDHPLRPIRQIVDEALGALLRSCTPNLAGRRFPLRDCFAPCCCRHSTGPFGAAVGGAARLHAEIWDVAVFTKNRERMIEGDIARKFMAAVLDQAGQGAVVGRSFLGRRHADRGVGRHEELSPQGRQRRAAGSRTQWRAGLSRREAQQRDARLDDGPRCSAVPARGQANLPSVPIWDMF